MYKASDADNSTIPEATNFHFCNNQQRHQHNNEFVQLNQQQQQPFTQHLENQQYQQPAIAQEVNQNGNDRNFDLSDSFSFTLDELGMIINSKDFEDLVDQKPDISQVNNQFQATTLQLQENQLQYNQQQRRATTNNFGLENGEITQQQVNNQDFEYSATTNQTANIQELYYQDYQQPIKVSDCQQEIYQLNPFENANFIADSPITTTNMTDRATTNNNPAYNNNKNCLYRQVDNNFKQTTTKPYVEIVEQPSRCALRFRYKCEGRSAGSLPGLNSTADNKTYPAIRIVNHVGRAVVVISCVTRDAPYRSHPHNIVGKEGCKKGICTIVINNEPDMVRIFTSLGIQCVKRKDIEESLTLRESINVDPFRNGFAHKLNASCIDLNVVRLCFQVFVEGSTPNKCDVPLTPIVSEPIHDKKAMSDLVITKLSHCSAPATGGREVILLCDRISKDDIQIRFYEERDGKVVWETYSDLSPTDVHKQVAICFKTPKYHNENITQPVMARIQLKRMSDNEVSEPRLFQFLPCESDEDIISRKRRKIEWVQMNRLLV